MRLNHYKHNGIFYESTVRSLSSTTADQADIFFLRVQPRTGHDRYSAFCTQMAKTSSGTVPAVLSDGWFSTVLFKKSKISGQCDRWIDRGLIPSKTERSRGYRKDRNIFLQLNLGNFNRF